jgi:hypothetical protein
VALLFTLFPSLKPCSPSTLSATARVVAVERAVTRDQWRWRTALGSVEVYRHLVRNDKAALRRPQNEPCSLLGTAPGRTVYTAIEVHGFKNRNLSMRAAIYDYRSGKRLPEREEFRGLTAIAVQVDVPTASSVQATWVAEPEEIGAGTKYFARAELYDPKGNLLAIADSKPFSPLSAHEYVALPRDCARAS